MSTDLELDALREQWQAEGAAPVPRDLRINVERQSRLMKIALIADILVTVVVGGGMTAWVLRNPGPDFALVAVATWLFIGIAWAVVLTANRGLWAPAAVDTAAFLDLSIRRCRSAVTSIYFAALLFVGEVTFGLAWSYHHAIKGHQSLWDWLWFGSLRIDIVWLITAACFAGAVWYRRKKKAQLRGLLRLHEEITAPYGASRPEAASPGLERGWFRLAGRWRRSRKINRA